MSESGMGNESSDRVVLPAWSSFNGGVGRFLAWFAVCALVLTGCGVGLLVALWRSGVSFWSAGYWAFLGTWAAVVCAVMAGIAAIVDRRRRVTSSDSSAWPSPVPVDLAAEAARFLRARYTVIVATCVALALVLLALSAWGAWTNAWSSMSDTAARLGPRYFDWLSPGWTWATISQGLLVGLALVVGVAVIMTAVAVGRWRRVLTEFIAQYEPFEERASEQPE